MEVKYPREVATAMELLERSGYAAYVVGGALRDALLGREAHDFDVTTVARPEDMARIFRGYPVIETGLAHGTLTVLIDGYPIEITTFRIDGAYRDSRHPEGVTFTDRVEGDLARRDFTVNAMAYNPRRGLVDAFGGIEDLRAGVIRAVGEPSARFDEDALRILRAFRFAAKLGFVIEERTLAAAEACREGLRRISAERITAELCGLFEGRWAPSALSAMRDRRIFEAIAPDFEVPPGTEEGLDRLPAVFEVRLAYFLRRCKDGGQSLLGRLRLSNASACRVRGLLRLADLSSTDLTEERARRLLAAAGPYGEDAEALAASDFFGLDEEGRRTLSAMMKNIRARGDCLTIDGLAINGRTLMERGLRGRAIGETLAALLDLVLAHPDKNQKDLLLAEAEKLSDGKF